MKTAFVLLSFGEYDGDDGVNPLPHECHRGIEKIRKLPYVVEVHPLFGEFDAIIKIEANDYVELGEKIVGLKKIKGVYEYKMLTGMDPSEFLKKK